ncbi:LysE family transporter [Cellulomonas sp.]|uniref:LysE family transporter n=1 Tax=Cellulomonas sp. TaxID=40001 RepID=UPI001B083ADC|nr:LysE family transporter [Cellulomonas sp.]MBO9555317.1 LysE family transporter [Cellulomonas sp.]
MSSAATALVLGALAGLAVAMPVGPVGVLLLRTGLLQGTRVAVGAAAGIATVDAGYAVLAVAAGAPVGRVAESHADVARLLSSGVLLVVGLAALAGWWRTRPSKAPATATEPDPVGPGPDLAGGAGGSPAGRAWAVQGRPTRRAVLGAYGRFVGLTAVNPLTAVTFATVAVGLAARVGERPEVAGATAFVVGAAVASLTWQLVLAVVSGGLGGRLGAVGRSRTSLVGALVVVGLAVAVAGG